MIDRLSRFRTYVPAWWHTLWACCRSGCCPSSSTPIDPITHPTIIRNRTESMAPPSAAGAGAAEGSAAAHPSTSTEGSSHGSSGAGGSNATSPPRGPRQQQQQGALAGNGMAKFVVFILLLGNLIMLPNVLQVRRRIGGRSRGGGSGRTADMA